MSSDAITLFCRVYLFFFLFLSKVQFSLSTLSTKLKQTSSNIYNIDLTDVPVNSPYQTLGCIFGLTIPHIFAPFMVFFIV